MIRLLVGLGNPGPEYEHTRHNAGFWWVDAAARRLGVRLATDRAFFGLAGRAAHAEGAVWLLEPQTFMNLSGKAVAALARFYKIAPQELLVVHDELDLPPGQMKLKFGGGHAGHNGLRDIHAQIGSPDYWRLRLGIGHPGVKAEVANYVLRKPPAAEREAIEQSIDTSVAQLDLLVAGRMEQAMMKLHARPATGAPALKPSGPDAQAPEGPSGARTSSATAPASRRGPG
jgi:PTH1 family peptidyl-tRNA hydrolase